MNFPRSCWASIGLEWNPESPTRLYALQQASSGLREELCFKDQVTRKQYFPLQISLVFWWLVKHPRPLWSHEWSTENKAPIRRGWVTYNTQTAGMSANLPTVSKPELHLPVPVDGGLKQRDDCPIAWVAFLPTCPPLPRRPPSSAHLPQHAYPRFCPADLNRGDVPLAILKGKFRGIYTQMEREYADGQNTCKQKGCTCAVQSREREGACPGPHAWAGITAHIFPLLNSSLPLSGHRSSFLQLSRHRKSNTLCFYNYASQRAYTFRIQTLPQTISNFWLLQV